MFKKFKLQKPRSFYEADASSGSGQGGGDGGNSSGGADSNANNTDLAKAQSEIARLGKLVNESAEREKTRQAEEAKKAEDEAKKRGEFEKLATDYKNSLDDVTAKHTSASEQLKSYDEYFNAQIEETMKSLDKDVKSAIDPLLEGKSSFEKAKALPGLLAVLQKSKGFG
jgi:hypothetical protein